MRTVKCNRFASCLLGGVTLAAVLMAAGSARAQQVENTAAACQDGADNDLDGYTDCADQDCAVMNFCSSGGGVVSQGLVVRPNAGRGLIVSGVVLSAVGLAAGAAALGLATQSTEDDAFLFSSIGVGAFGWLISVVGGGLHIGGQSRTWRSVRAAGGQPRMGIGVASIVLYGLMSLSGAAVAIMGPTVGPATGVGSAPFWGPQLAMEAIYFGVLLPAGIVAMRVAAGAGRPSAITLLPFCSANRESGATVMGITAVF